MGRWIVFVLLSFACCATARAQMSVDEAMERLHERQAERAATAATQPSATQPSQGADEGAHLPDLSLRIHALEAQVREDFSGSIGVMWTPSATQQWLDDNGTKAAAAITQLADSKASAKVIIENVTLSPEGVICIQGHLFSDDRVALSNADRMALKPQQDQYDSASSRLESLQSQLSQAQSEYQFASLHERAASQAGQSGNNVLSVYGGPTSSALSIQISDLQSEIAAARGALTNAGEALGAGQTQLLAAEQDKMQRWGPIKIFTDNPEMIGKLPGSIVTLAVKVTNLGVDVARTPDGARWDFGTDMPLGGQSKMPSRADDPALGTPDVRVYTEISCDDLSSPPAPKVPAAPPSLAAGDGSKAEFASATVTAPGSAGATLADRDAAFVTSPRDESAVGQSVGFVVLGCQAILADGRKIELTFESGSCFAVTPTGYLLTNHHVVADKEILDDPDFQRDMFQQANAEIESRVWVFFGRDEYQAKVVYTSPKFDLAVLRISRPGQKYFRLASQAGEMRGSDVFAAGFPGLGSTALGTKELEKELISQDQTNSSPDIASQFKDRDFEYTLTRGAVGRVVSDTDGGQWIQHEALIRHGNSGGPLISESGVALGINTFMQKDDEGDVQTNMTEEISQLRRELDAHVPGLVWVTP
jgi:S1-C subfamily serine protease